MARDVQRLYIYFGAEMWPSRSALPKLSHVESIPSIGNFETLLCHLPREASSSMSSKDALHREKKKSTGHPTHPFGRHANAVVPRSDPVPSFVCAARKDVLWSQVRSDE